MHHSTHEIVETMDIDYITQVLTEFKRDGADFFPDRVLDGDAHVLYSKAVDLDKVSRVLDYLEAKAIGGLEPYRKALAFIKMLRDVQDGVKATQPHNRT